MRQLGSYSGEEIGQISVSMDGTWQKRCGHNSLLGASFVISIDNGLVLIMISEAKHVRFAKETQMHPKIGRRNMHQFVK